VDLQLGRHTAYVAYELIFHGELPNPCRRGYQSHEWWVYEVTGWRGTPSLKEQEKHAFMKFMSKEEIGEYVRQHDVDPAWLLTLPKLGIARS
jgi:hypothetical protein